MPLQIPKRWRQLIPTLKIHVSGGLHILRHPKLITLLSFGRVDGRGCPLLNPPFERCTVNVFSFYLGFCVYHVTHVLRTCESRVGLCHINCKFWIYWVCANTKFTNMTTNYCKFCNLHPSSNSKFTIWQLIV